MKNVLSGATHPHKWWASLKSALFGVDSTLPPIAKPDGTVTYDPTVKADLFSSHFRSKQSQEDVDLPLACSSQPVLCSVAFRSSEVESLLCDLDSFGGSDPLGFFPLFFKSVSSALAPKLSTVFRILIRLGKFLVC